MANNKHKGRSFWECIERRLSSAFHPTAPKFLAYGILLLAGIWLALVWTNLIPFRVFCAFGADSAPLGSIYGTLVMVLATVSALFISLMFVAVQLSANTYTPRVMKIHFYSAHFIGFSGVLLGTIFYLSWRLGQAQAWGLVRCRFAETGFILFFASLALLIPYIWISVKLLQPKHLFEWLMWSITRNDFRKASEGPRKAREKLDEKLQPVIDIIRRAARDGQLRTVQDAFRAMMIRVWQLERFPKDEKLTTGIGWVLAEKLREVGLYANSIHSVEASTELHYFISGLFRFYSSREIRSGLLAFGKTLDDLNYDWQLKYTRQDYPLQYAEGLALFAIRYGELADIAEKEKREYLDKAVKAYHAALEVRTRKEFPAGFATTRNNLGAAYIAIARVSEGKEQRVFMDKAVEAYHAALEVRTRKEFPAGFAMTQN
ncbi:DUF2254 domain-containing protein, partial [candidate division WOR-3 bacterium]|nr:DUF2254 domain-containing protein [candidate division WOR-3 bacterium]